MATVVDNDKDRAKTYLRNDVKSYLTTMDNAVRQIDGLVAILDSAVNGSTQQSASQAVQCCQAAAQQTREAIAFLRRCQMLVERLDVTREVPDDQF